MIRASRATLGDLPVCRCSPATRRGFHLWYEQKFGVPFSPLSARRRACFAMPPKTHAVAARLEAGGAMDIKAPFGLDDMFSFR